jgi:hypothetical protein
MPTKPAAEYDWAGTTYAGPTAFTAATGQGAHDLDADPMITTYARPLPAEGSPAIDSANADAPGELGTDLNGSARVDDPLVANTGAGSRSYDDRGAFELADLARQSIGPSSPQ